MKRRYFWCYAICQLIRKVLKCILNVVFFKLIIDFMIKQLKKIQKSGILVKDGPCEDGFFANVYSHHPVLTSPGGHKHTFSIAFYWSYWRSFYCKCCLCSLVSCCCASCCFSKLPSAELSWLFRPTRFTTTATAAAFWVQEGHALILTSCRLR